MGLTACGDGAADDDSAAIEISGSSGDDAQIAADLGDYLDRNLRPSQGDRQRIDQLCSGDQRTRREAQCEQVEALESVYASIQSISVDDGVITIDTELADDQDGRTGAELLCQEIQGADVADFTAGHSILGEDDQRLAECQERALP